jgi:hypothetical protein
MGSCPLSLSCRQLIALSLNHPPPQTDVSFGLIPMITYGTISLTCYIVELAWIACGRPDALGWLRWVRGTKADNDKRISKRHGRTVSQGGVAGSARKEPTARTG